MITIKATFEEVKSDYPEVYNEFIQGLRSSSSESKDMKEEKIKWFYTWGTFTKKAKKDSDRVENELNYSKRFLLPYEERLVVEESRMRVDITMEAGKYLRGDRTTKESTLSSIILKYSRELMKKQMIAEQQNVDVPNQAVIDSIPEINNDIIRELIPPQMQEMFDKQQAGIQNPANRRTNNTFDMDDILDKISSSGIESLSDEEREFLKKQSE